VRDSVDVINQNGTVEIAGLPPSACTRVTVKTSFAPVRVNLPEGVGYTITARTSFGKINSEMPVTASGSLTGEALNGKIGDGRCAVSVTNNNGNIDFLRGK
jgi:hypothetical protein